ncbi:hypothetical protein AAFF_G00308280 [Aldrovandia affinis]|uniref:Uncharacterized protein n=1 Tax=Aldrovandia affinis TaxID=143900 RepID=A0AAD7SNX2_9TELE|nr:hypothetical protein AAFF_G00308280 [Aldrovandia affinis]
MALFGKVLEPVGYMQTLRGLAQSISSYLDGSSTPDELDVVKKNLDHIDQELGGGERGLLSDTEVHQLEGDLAAVFGHLGALVRARPAYTKRETEAFLQCAQDLRLERQLTAIHARLMGVCPLTTQPTLLEELIQNHQPKRWEMRQFCEKVNFVLGAGLLCLFTQASLTGRDQALLLKTWGERMGALYRHMKATGALCAGYFLDQAPDDMRRVAGDAQRGGKPLAEQAANVLKALEKNYDWLRWAVMVVACYRDAPTSLDKSRIHQLIVDLEWKIPNPPPEVYASLEEEPERAGHYLADRMLRKLREGLGAGVAVHVVPGHMEMRCNFPQASFYLYEYKHRLATGTLCVFG